MTRRDELLRFEGVSRSVLERRIVALVRVLDAAEELVAADDAATGAGPDEQPEDRCEQAWDALRAALRDDV